MADDETRPAKPEQPADPGERKPWEIDGATLPPPPAGARPVNAPPPGPGFAPPPSQEAPAGHPVQSQQPIVPLPVTAGMPPPQPKQQGAFGRGFGLGLGFTLGSGLILGVVGGLGMLLTVAMIGALIGGGADTKTGLGPTKTVWGDAGAKDRLIAIPITGVILGDSGDGQAFGAATYGHEVAKKIDSLGAKDAGGLILEMNTPGGTIYGSRAIADAVTRYQQRTGHKVLAYVRGMSASGGMYAMAGADKIVADHGTMVGSIGVIMGPLSQYRDVVNERGILGSGVDTRGGITKEYLTQGRGKDFGNPYRPITPEERAVYTANMAVEYEAFVAHVSQHRKIPVDTIKNDIGAYMFDPKTAVTRKLVDAEMGSEDAYREAAQMNGLSPGNVRVERVDNPSLIGALLGAQKPDGAAVPRTPITTGVLCGGAPVVLAYQGDPMQHCS